MLRPAPTHDFNRVAISFLIASALVSPEAGYLGLRVAVSSPHVKRCSQGGRHFRGASRVQPSLGRKNKLSLGNDWNGSRFELESERPQISSPKFQQSEQ